MLLLNENTNMSKKSLILVCNSSHRGIESPFIYRAGEHGPCWRVKSGLVFLSNGRSDVGESFAGIACAGDLLGSEALLRSAYIHDTLPLGKVELEQCADLSTEMLLLSLLSAQRRAEEVLALRIGDADGRIRRLLSILSTKSLTESGMMYMPTLKEMAEMTALNHETVCRVIGRFRQLGQLQRFGRHNGVVALEPKRRRPAYATRNPNISLTQIACGST